MERVFVYGLLRRGQTLAHNMAGATFVGDATLDGFDLFHLGNYPGAMEGDGTLIGEVYEVDSLDGLDATERIHDSPPLYRRVRITALDQPTWIYVYARPLTDSFKIESGDWVRRY